jgi:hypothetical protein
VRRLTGILLLAIFAGSQTGWLNYLHLREHCGMRQVTRSQITVATPWPVDGHDERTCPICTTLHMPLASAGYVPPLVCFGLLLAFLTLLNPRPAARQAFAWVESRGPPMV